MNLGANKMPAANKNETVLPPKKRTFQDAFQDFLSKRISLSRFQEDIYSYEEQSEPDGWEGNLNNGKISRVKILSDVTIKVSSTCPKISHIPNQTERPAGVSKSPHTESNISCLELSKVPQNFGCSSKITLDLDRVEHKEFALSTDLVIPTREENKKLTGNEQILCIVLPKQIQNNVKKDLTSAASNSSAYNTPIKLLVPLKENCTLPLLKPVESPKPKLPALESEKSINIDQSVLLKPMQNIHKSSAAILEENTKLSVLTEMTENDMKHYSHSSSVNDEILDLMSSMEADEQGLVTPNTSLLSQATLSELRSCILLSNKSQKSILQMSLQKNPKTVAADRRQNLTDPRLSLPKEAMKKHMISKGFEHHKNYVATTPNQFNNPLIQSSNSTEQPQKSFQESNQENVVTCATNKRSHIVSSTPPNWAQKLSPIPGSLNPNLELWNQAKRFKVDLPRGRCRKSSEICQELQRKPLKENVAVPIRNSIPSLSRSPAEKSASPIAFTQETNNNERDCIKKNDKKRVVTKGTKYIVIKSENDCKILMF